MKPRMTLEDRLELTQEIVDRGAGKDPLVRKLQNLVLAMDQHHSDLIGLLLRMLRQLHCMLFGMRARTPRGVVALVEAVGAGLDAMMTDHNRIAGLLHRTHEAVSGTPCPLDEEPDEAVTALVATVEGIIGAVFGEASEGAGLSLQDALDAVGALRQDIGALEDETLYQAVERSGNVDAVLADVYAAVCPGQPVPTDPLVLRAHILAGVRRAA